jgi:hypothetical protein
MVLAEAAMAWRIEFSSAKFLPTLPEDCQLDPGRYGFELALWLAQALNRHGIVTGYPNGDEWAWFLDYEPSDTLSLAICCASRCDAGAGYAGGPVAWSISLHDRRRLNQRIRNLSHDAELQALGQRIVALLRDEQIEPVQLR